MKKILGIGNALVDVIVKIDDEALFDKFDLKKGGMEMIDVETKREIHRHISHLQQTVATGGSTSNTIHGLAHLGVPTGYIGKISDDKFGDFFKNDLLDKKITPHLISSKELDTGIATTFITEDTERTFATYLGAASGMNTSEIDEAIFGQYDLIHIEGYLVFNHDLILTLCRLAKKHNLLVSMDMASYNLMEENREFMMDLLKNYVDIIFGNELEVAALTGVSPEKSLDVLAEVCDTVIVKLGKQGSLIKMNGEKLHIPVVPARCIDSNGLGDIYAAGFLYGLINDYTPYDAGYLASTLAAYLCEYVGAKLPTEQWQIIKQQEHALLNKKY